MHRANKQATPRHTFNFWANVGCGVDRASRPHTTSATTAPQRRHSCLLLTLQARNGTVAVIDPAFARSFPAAAAKRPSASGAHNNQRGGRISHLRR
jgi:hypothetical protein